MAPTTISSKIIRSETRDTAKDAYLYAFAMMESYNTWYPQAADKTSPTYVGGFNTFRHYAQLFTPENRDVVTPNNDTPYSWAWLDLRAEPIVVSVAAVAKDRYYVLQFTDLFTYNCAYSAERFQVERAQRVRGEARAARSSGIAFPSL
jgi:hypothetical protein